MKIITSATNITIGTTVFPLNSLYFKTEGENILIFMIGTSNALIQAPWTDFLTSAGIPYANQAAVITDLKTSMTAFA